MKKIIAALCVSSILVTSTFAATGRPDGGAEQWIGPNNADYCLNNPSACPEANTSERSAKKHSNTGTIVMISVASAAVFAGAMWYIFKKMPSENNPGQVKLAEF
ncbi:MAG: hypothetical protein NC311_01770 [Muribaculaceae bacterium]|nr:hypothetical protein [Muribaculaceae bacterium]